MAQAIPALEPAARDLWPESFAGLWLGEGGYGDTIQIAFTEGAEEKVAALAQGFPRPELLRALSLERSIAGLERRQERMISDRELARAGTLALPGVPGASYDLGIDQRRNAIYVVLEAASPEAVAAFKGLYGEDVIVEEGPLAVPAQEEALDPVDEAAADSAASSCSRQDCRYRLRSGLAVRSPAGGVCSSAFTVRRPDGTRQILSAAHCSQSARRHGGERYGEVREQQWAGRVDAERHSVEGVFAAKPWIFVDGGEKRRKVYGTSTWEGLPGRASICKSGQTTNRDCGKVIDKHFSPGGDWGPNSNRFIKSDNGPMCVQGGDSGSGVYGANDQHPHRAHGIVSGAAGRPNGGIMSCGNPDYFSFFGHIEYAENALNVTVVKAG